MLQEFSLVRYLKGLLSFVLHLNAELVFATIVFDEFNYYVFSLIMVRICSTRN